MKASSFITAASALIMISGVARADTVLKPVAGKGYSINLGEVMGNGYYTVEDKGYHVVITITKDEYRPIRFETILVQDQSILLSAPGNVDAKLETIKILRENDNIVVTIVR